MKLIIDIPENVYKGAKLLEPYADSVVQIPLEVIVKALPFEDFANKLKDNVYKLQRDSLSDEYAECYHIALLEVVSCCQEVNE